MSVMFRDPHLSEVVTWRSALSGTHVLRAMVRAPDEVQNFSGINIQAGTLVLHVRVSDVAGLASGDVFDVRGETRMVQGHPD
ncbi:MAG: hypothetical protein ABJL67_13395 [Sulfitobacter sp.]